ncbi:MAG: choice-of-anchor D domain-containing protein [Sulfurimonas sp.]|nr:choice-of-anchor D domain-containing protein [Sulfurimonas sp.]
MKTFNLFSRLIVIFGFVMILAISGWADTNNNDSCANAENVSLNYSTTSGSMTKDSDRDDYYAFSVSTAGTLTITTTNANRDLDGYLFEAGSCNSSGTGTVTKDTSGSDNVSITYNVTSAQSFIFDLYDYENKSTNYNLTITFVSSAPTPEMNIKGNSVDITDNDSTPSTSDNTDFGSVTIGNSVTKTFIIENTGTGTLNLTGSPRVVTNGDFSVTTQPSATVAAGGSTSFIVQFTPSTAGIKNQTISLSNNDSNENPYNFSIRGTGLTPIAQAAPTITTIPNQTAYVGAAISLNMASYVSDINNDVITYGLIGTLPAGLIFNTTTGYISGTPTAVTAATNFRLTATDSAGSGTTTTSNIFTISVTEQILETSGGRDFVQRTQHSLFGDVKVIGNTVLCILNNGVCVEPTNNNSNADTNLQKAPQSYSTLTLPTNAVIQYARVYWQGRKAATSTNDAWDNTSKNSAATIGIRKGATGSFTPLTADIKDFDSTDSNNYVRTYSASANAMSVVTGADTYYIDTANFYTNTGKTNDNNPSDGLGAYGAWVLVIVYNDPNETKARNVTLFDGYKQVTKDTGNIDISVSGFLTPRTGTVDSKTYVFTAEGDKYLEKNGDVIKMAGLTYHTTLQTLGTFNSRVDVLGTRSPSLSNNNGIDIHKYDTGTTTGAKNIIDTNEVGAKFQFTSDQDTYFPSLIVFSTELYLPQLCYDYSIKQDGHYFNIDRTTYPIAHLDGYISSSPVEVTVYLKNKEADIDAQGIALKADVNDTLFDLSGNIFTSNVNGSTLIDRGTPTSSATLCDYNRDGDNSVTNSGCTNGHDIRKGNGSLSAQDYVYTKYILQPNNVTGVTRVSQPLGLSIKYYITANGNKVEYPDYVLGGVNVPLCPPTASYQPEWGYFNVVQSGQANNSIKNNIYSQISRKPFDATVVFDSTPATGNNQAPTSNIKTTLLVEIIDIDAFGDINASCANPDSSLSEPIFTSVNFTNTSFQANLTTQSNDYYNFAVQNAAFRIWYFNDVNGTLIQDWNATTTNANKTLTGIAGLYKPTTHTLCSSQCATPTSTTCFDCIKTNYAQPICSRDNFSIRPESYDLRLYDVNQTLPAYDIATDPTNLKNTTKVDLSNKYGYDPLHSTPTDRINLASEYNYRFDIAATGHDGITFVPGYTRYFNGELDYNAVLLWDPQSTKTGCNDITDKNISFYVGNGVMQNEEHNHLEVGEYKLNIFDTTWTARDWQNMTHHTTANAFTLDPDCNTNSNSSTLTNYRYGCNVSTDHGSDGGGRVYKDHDLTFHPYKFDVLGIIASVGLNHDINVTNAFIYMADMNQSQDENMSFHLNGTIIAKGYNNVVPSNFVNNCYAKALDINVTETNTSHTNSSGINLAYQLRFHDINASGSVITSFDINATKTLAMDDANIQTGQNYFTKDLNGSMSTVLNLNYSRESNVTANPKTIYISKYKVNCINSEDECTFNANLDENTTQGEKDINATIKHYYGRTNVPKQVYISPVGTTGTPANDLIYYEVFCNGTGCDKTLLSNGVNSRNSDDPRWFINTSHIAGFGTAGNINQKNAANVTATTAGGVHQDSTNIVYDTLKGYPYKATMEHNASSWLIYNRYNAAATLNEFEVEFQAPESGWTGIHNNNINTAVGKGAIWTNKRLDW